MKRIWMAMLYLIALTFPVSSHAFLCYGKDLECLKGWILPFNQATDPDDKYREWSASEGVIFGKDNVIIFKLKFDNVSLDTLSYQYPWYSPKNTVFNGFGLEIDLCDPSGTLRFDYVKSNFPSAARPTRDTDLSDSINSCKNAMGMLIRNPGAIVPGEEYEVQFFLKDQLPVNGVVITPSLQISADTHLFDYAALTVGQSYLFDGNLLGGYLDKFEYFAIESDGYAKYWNSDTKDPWKVYRDGHEGVCWTSKATSYPCSITNSAVLYGPLYVEREQEPKPFGVTMLPASIPDPFPPDFIVRKTWLVTPWGDEVYKFGLQESFDTKAQSENIGDGPCNPEDPIQTITSHFYLSRGYKEDVHSGDGAWRRIDSTITQCDNLAPNETHTETKNTVISQWITEPGIYNIVYCIDHPQDDHNNGGEHLEKHESNNCSTEAVFEVTANAIENPDPRFVDFVTSGMQFRGTSPYYAGDQARFGATITNRGNISSPSDIRSSYSVECPGTSRIYLADDGTMASTLSAGASAFEENVGPVTLPNVAGTCTAYFCADYQGAVAESDEANNCTSFAFVLQPRPAPNLVITQFQDEVGCCTTNTGSRIKPDIWVRNNGPIAPASDVTVTYHISSPVATGGAWWHIGYGIIHPSELPPGGTDEDYMEGNGYPIPQNSAWKLQWHTIRGCLKANGSAPVGDPNTEVCAYYTRYSKK